VKVLFMSGYAGDKLGRRGHRLLHHVILHLLRDSFCGLKRQASFGGDGVTWQEYETGLEGRLTNTIGCPATRVSCASSGAVYADCGGAF
jgi:hypothetical protein